MSTLQTEKELSGLKIDCRVNDNKTVSVKPDLIDPDEIVDLGTLKFDSSGKSDDDASESSDSSDDSSLQPYDLTDDDSDLKKPLSNLVDVVGALGKSDDADGVRCANLLNGNF